VGAPTPVGVGGLGIYRSDKGTLLCPGPSPFQATGQILGEAITPAGQANATAVQIKQQGSALPIGGPTLLPSGQLQVQPNNQTFPDVKVGGCPQPPSTRTFMLTNIGHDCITVSAIGAIAPYSATSSRPFPADLDPGVSLTATVTFAPGSVGPYNNVNLPITRTPSNGDSNLICSGKAVQALPSFAATPSRIDFGQIPVGVSAAPVTITVKNTGDVPIAVSIPGAPSGSPFRWTGFNGPLGCGKAQPIAVTFTPQIQGAAAVQTVSVVSTPGGMKSVTLQGAGCIRNALIGVPPWEDLGGAITGPLSAVTWGPNRLDIFGVAQSRSSHLWLVYC
jgi:hypothetical protein